MRKIFFAIPVLISSVVLAEVKTPVASVSSRAPFTLQGVSVPVVGSASWPAMEGDVIETKSASAEVRLKDGTRIFIPSGSRYVVSNSIRTSAVTTGGGKAAAVSSSSAAVAKAHNGFVSGVLNVLDGGAFVVNNSMLQSLALAATPGPKTVGSSSSNVLSLSGFLQQFGVSSPIVAQIDQALQTPGAVVTQVTSSGPNPTTTFIISGIQVSQNGAPPAPATIVIAPPTSATTTSTITVVSGTFTAPPPPTAPVIVTVTAPPASGTGNPVNSCRGASFTPTDVSNSVINTSITGGSC